MKQLKSKQTPLNLSLSGHLRLCLCLCQLCFSFFLCLFFLYLSLSSYHSLSRSFSYRSIILSPSSLYHSLFVFFISFSICILYVILSLYFFLFINLSFLLCPSLSFSLYFFISPSFLYHSLYIFFISSLSIFFISFCLHLLYIILSPSSLNHSLSVFFYLHRCITLIVSLPVFHSICISFYQSFYWSIHFVCSKSSLYPLSTFTSTSVPRHFFSPFIFWSSKVWLKSGLHSFIVMASILFDDCLALQILQRKGFEAKTDRKTVKTASYTHHFWPLFTLLNHFNNQDILLKSRYIS